MACNQIKRKIKSGAYKVSSLVEAEYGYVTSTEAMTHIITGDLWLQAASKRLKVQISHSDMWTVDVFYYKTCYDRFVYFIEKKTLCLTRKYKASLRKKNSWF